VERLQTRCKAADALIDGGLATGTITQVFGEKALGKSIFSLQAAFATAVNGNSAVIIDTEQSYHSYLLPYWKERFSRRFGKDVTVQEVELKKSPKFSKKNPISRSQLVTALSGTLNELGVSYTDVQIDEMADLVSPEYQVDLEVNEPSVFVFQIPDVVELLLLHGIVARKDVSKGGRVELRLQQTPVYESALHNIVSESKAKLVIYDSISAPFKATFPSTQDLPARSSGIAMLLSHAQRLCIEFGISVVTTSHVSIDPINEWDRRPYGGVILGHDAKFSLELTKNDAKRDRKEMAKTAINPEDAKGSTRGIWIQRHPAFEDYSKSGYAKLDDEGFH